MKHFIVIIMVLFWQKAWAWGTMGHMVVAQVAENNLSSTAKKSVNKMLLGKSLADVANWADSIKSRPEWAHSKPWHFVDIPDGEDYSTVEHTHDGDVVTAITEMVDVLKSKTANPIEKENALKFIVHFVGDIHQPLHVGKPDDRGGNSLQVVFEGRKTNLHALWDTIMIMKSPMDYVKYAASLETQSFQLPPYDIQEITFSRIISECMGARKGIYDFKNASVQPIKLEPAYFNKNLALMNAQLLTGGKRLAILLNAIFK